MNWVEVTVEVDGEAAEAVADVLHRYGYQGVAIEQAGFPIEVWPDEIPPADRLIVRAYFLDNDEAEANKQKLREALYYMGKLYPMPEPRFSIVRDEDWAEAWKAHYQPVRLGRRIYIRPAWVEPTAEQRPDDIVLIMDPGMAFGTGTHPTTQLCLIALEELMSGERAALEGGHVLDLGCGSGILAIAAIKLGAADALGVDIDELAITSTQENAALNGVADRITVQQGSLEVVRPTGRQFDLLLMNILAKAIIGLCDEGLGEVLRPGAPAIFSGIIQDQADDVEAALRRTGLEPVQRRTAGDWVVIEARKRGG